MHIVGTVAVTPIDTGRDVLSTVLTRRTSLVSQVYSAQLAQLVEPRVRARAEVVGRAVRHPQRVRARLHTTPSRRACRACSSKQFQKGVRVKGVVSRHSVQGARVGAARRAKASAKGKASAQ